MGFFKKIKRLFVKPVEMQSGKKNELVVRSSSSGRIKIGKPLSVPDDFVCLFVCKEKVLDRFTSGEYKLKIENIPAVCRALKLNVPNKRGKYKNSFFADIYYLNLTEILDKAFESQQGIYVKDKNFLGTTVFVSGEYSFVLNDPILFLEALLKLYGILNGKLAQRQLDIWVGELVDKKIEKNKCSLDLLNERDSSCFEGLIEYLNKNLADVGVKITKIGIKQTILPKNVYRKTSLRYKEQFDNPVTQQVEQSQTDSENAVESSLVESTNSQLNGLGFDFKVDIQQLKNDSEDLSSGPFSNTATTDKLSESQEHSTTSFMNPVETIQQQEYLEAVETDDYEIPEPPESLEQLQTKVAYKKCKNCGAINSKQSKVCFECKTPFLKVCQKCGCHIENGDFVCPKCKSIVI